MSIHVDLSLNAYLITPVIQGTVQIAVKAIRQNKSRSPSGI
jgi:hypothetical protein